MRWQLLVGRLINCPNDWFKDRGNLASIWPSPGFLQIRLLYFHQAHSNHATTSSAANLLVLRSVAIDVAPLLDSFFSTSPMTVCSTTL